MKPLFPKVTFLYLLLGIAVCRLDNNAQWLSYNRETPLELWRYLLASFAHYDFKHLVLNLMVFFILGIKMEQRTTPVYFGIFVLLTAISSTFLLHCFLHQYSSYMGISTVNYAVLGFLLVSMFNLRKAELAICVLVILFYQVFSVKVAVTPASSLIRPVWELHVLALFSGMVTGLCYCFRGRLGDVE